MLGRLLEKLGGSCRRLPATNPSAESQPLLEIELRVAASILTSVRSHVEDFSFGEEAGFLVCSPSRHDNLLTLLAREWMPFPTDSVTRNTNGFVLAWDAGLNSAAIERALELNATLVLVHSHGSDPAPRFSGPDQVSADKFFPSASRLLEKPCGSVVLGDGAAYGEFWLEGMGGICFRRLVSLGATIEVWWPTRQSTPSRRRRLDRQTAGLGPGSEPKLAASSVGVIGLSGGGSHVCQQLAHQGHGRIVVIDDQLVEDVNLSRMIGSTPADVDTTLKTGVMTRLIASIDPTIEFRAVSERFPSVATIEALKSVDVVVACVDSFAAREQINAFCRRYLIPLVDIGIAIKTEQGRLAYAVGQMVVVTPDSPCLRCGPLLSDAVLDRERRERPPEYDRNPDAPGAPQVVSMNGVLASEAANTVLDLVTSYAGGDRGAGWWNYNGRAGVLERVELPPRERGCPACAERGLGDESH